MKVSVVIPVYNVEKFVLRCIESKRFVVYRYLKLVGHHCMGRGMEK